MNYFGTAEKHALRLKQIDRMNDLDRMDAVRAACEDGRGTKAEQIEMYFLVLASRLLRAKFYASPGYTNEELSYLTGCSSGTYLGLIMTRQKTCSRDMAILISDSLKKLEKREGMQPILQPDYPV